MKHLHIYVYNYNKSTNDIKSSNNIRYQIIKCISRESIVYRLRLFCAFHLEDSLSNESELQRVLRIVPKLPKFRASGQVLASTWAIGASQVLAK
jgi:hypothetical protein